MRTFCILGGEPQVKSFRKDIRKARTENRTLALKFFQLKANLAITQIEEKLAGNDPINLDITTHFGGATKSLTPTDLVVNVCWGWGKLSYSHIAYPDLILYIDPDRNWDYRCGNYSFDDLKDWKSASEPVRKVLHNIIFDVLKVDELL